jgi:hypothetical protein
MKDRTVPKGLKKYGGKRGPAWTQGVLPKSPFTQKSMEDLESKGWQGRDWPGPNAAPKLDNINLHERLKGIKLQTAGQKVTGSASLKIALENFPRGTRTTSKLAGMFKDLNIDRGSSAPWNA